MIKIKIKLLIKTYIAYNMILWKNITIEVFMMRLNKDINYVYSKL